MNASVQPMTRSGKAHLALPCIATDGSIFELWRSSFNQQNFTEADETGWHIGAFEVFCNAIASRIVSSKIALCDAPLKSNWTVACSGD